MQFLNITGLDRRSYKWTLLDASEACSSFPRLSVDEIRELTLGVYQVKLARSYTQEHCSHDGGYDILVSSDVPMIFLQKYRVATSLPNATSFGSNTATLSLKGGIAHVTRAPLSGAFPRDIND